MGERRKPGGACGSRTSWLRALAPIALVGGAWCQESDAPVLPGELGAGREAAVAERLEFREVGTDEHENEALGARAGERLKALLVIWSTAGAAAVEPFVSADFEGDAPLPELGPERLRGAFRLRSAPVREERAPAPPLVGPEELARGLGEWARSLGSSVAPNVKVISVERLESGLRVRARISARGTSSADRRQHDALWECDWTLPPDGELLRLRRLRVLTLDEVTGPAAPMFADCALSALGSQPAFREQLAHGVEYWGGRMDAALELSSLGHQGVAVGDVDGDGLEDVYLPQPGGLPNLLFLRRADGSAVERARAGGVDYLDLSTSALLIDLDGDADRDLALAMGDRILLLANDGRGVFEPRAVHDAPFAMSLAAADPDGDGDLDLYVCCYVSPYADETAPVPYHDANNGQANLLLENGGEFRFHDATAERGLDENNTRFSFAAAWEDFDDDGDQDLYVANDFGRNNLYRNDGGRFTDVAAAAGVEDLSAGMGVSWGDFDRDGLVDLYVSNMYSSAGRRVTYQRQFRPQADEALLGDFQRHARGNSLFRNRGDGTFEDVTLSVGAEMGRWAWGALFVDLDNDGWQDLFVPNGFVTNRRTDDL
ncbi:MAG TPA: VCBS repeat-containing protein [Planctomycetota bacterium]|nr:VCBS repeat-containing protein [Planctomycetota bacterium]